ncbi:hypothetical protein GGR55DRAFT_677229 [Xylaria sp. FL0064]|nr:hypothetical protein GGR55DRAFT_677229 [Xylaria sp. FL0064]
MSIKIYTPRSGFANMDALFEFETAIKNNDTVHWDSITHVMVQLWEADVPDAPGRATDRKRVATFQPAGDRFELVWHSHWFRGLPVGERYAFVVSLHVGFGNIVKQERSREIELSTATPSIPSWIDAVDDDLVDPGPSAP